MDWRNIQAKLADTGYISDPNLAMAIAMTQRLKRPLLIEGEAGVGKTDVAKSSSSPPLLGGNAPFLERGDRRLRSTRSDSHADASYVLACVANDRPAWA